MKGQSSIQATRKSKNASRINEKKKAKVEVVIKFIGFHELYLSS